MLSPPVSGASKVCDVAPAIVPVVGQSALLVVCVIVLRSPPACAGGVAAATAISDQAGDYGETDVRIQCSLPIPKPLRIELHGQRSRMGEPDWYRWKPLISPPMAIEWEDLVGLAPAGGGG